MLHRLPVFTAFALFLLISVSCKKEEPVTTDQELTELLEDEMHFQKIPALSVLVFDRKQVVYENHLGMANRESGLRLQNDHLFLLASISKTITATALLQQYDRGKFQLDDPINSHLPFEVKVPNQSTPITFRMLLTHTAGIADGPALDQQYYYGQDSPVALETFLKHYLTTDGPLYDATKNFHRFEPGTQHAYSNVGTALIGYLVERLSGQNFNTYCKQHIFGPLGMNHTAWRLDEIEQTIVTPYSHGGGKYRALEHYTFTDYPNGGLRSTARDLHTFAVMLIRGGEHNGTTILNRSTVQKMLTPQIPAIDGEVGLHLFRINEQLGLWGHDGGEKGVSTILAFDPERGVGVVALANQGNANLDYLLEAAYRYGKR